MAAGPVRVRLAVFTAVSLFLVGASGLELQEGVWTKIFPDHACGIAVDPSNPSTIYMGVNGGFAGGTGSTSGIYKTTDGGGNWARIGRKVGMESTEFGNDVFPFVDPNDPNHIYGYTGVSGDYGFYVSTDAGATWRTPQDWYDVQVRVGITSCSGMNDCYGLATDPTDFNHLLVSFHSPWSWCDGNFSNAGVVESTDGGETWTAHLGQDGFGYGNGVGMLYNPDAGVGNADTWLLGSQGSGYWRTTNAGGSWDLVSTVTQTHGGCQVYAASNGAFYVSSNNGILRSSDGGASWDLLNSADGLHGSYFLAIAGDGRNLYTCPSTGGAMCTSPESDGTTWTQMPGFNFNNGPIKLACDRTNGIVYAPCSPDGLWAYRIPGGATRAKAAVKAPSQSVAPRRGLRVALGAQSVDRNGQTVLFSVDGKRIRDRDAIAGQAVVISPY
jgi:photosystem II stability/assembly factor-like uncharacterized protein